MWLQQFGRAIALFMLTIVFTSAARGIDSSGCQASTADEAQVVGTIRTMYTAAATDDLTLFHSVITADFYAFDGGKRFDGDALLNMVKAQHAAGNLYVWNVTEPEVHVTCALAWITCVNRGSL